MNNDLEAFQRLSAILDILRKQCPWDSKQTFESLRYLTIEEVYELSEAILQEQPTEMREELGDLFMHVVFYSKIAQDRNLFTLADVLNSISDKLVSRHPHIALPDKEGHMQGGTQNAKPQWEKIKMKEGRRSILEGVPESLPTLVKTIRMQEKVAGVGFEFPSNAAAFAKVEEEYAELKEALADTPHSDVNTVSDNNNSTTPTSLLHAEEEFGDLLFALIKWGNRLGINADDALAKTNEKFQRRFSYIEDTARQNGGSIANLSPEEMLSYWNKAKETETTY